MAFFADFQYYQYADVGGSRKGQKHADVIYELRRMSNEFVLQIVSTRKMKLHTIVNIKENKYVTPFKTVKIYWPVKTNRTEKPHLWLLRE